MQCVPSQARVVTTDQSTLRRLSLSGIRLLQFIFLMLLFAQFTLAQSSPLVYTTPHISSIDNQLINMGTSTAALSFIVGVNSNGAAGTVAALKISGVSTNTALVPATGIVLSGPNPNNLCTVTLTPKATYSGVTTIVLTVMNGTASAKTSFTLTVNGKPTISSIANQEIGMSKATSALSFTVGDALTTPASLTVTGASSNTSLVPTANIALTRADAGNCTVTVTPMVAKSGTTTITLTVKDGGGLTATTSFVLKVDPIAAPTFSPAAGTYYPSLTTQGIMVTISCSTPGAVIYYTTDGTAPTVTPAKLYKNPVPISKNTTLRAFAYISGGSPTIVSSVTTGAYVIGTNVTPGGV